MKDANVLAAVLFGAGAVVCFVSALVEKSLLAAGCGLIAAGLFVLVLP
jgi:hypothetical protein